MDFRHEKTMGQSSSESSQPLRRRVTLREIAARAGLHVTAVSMALRDHPRISAATRERVRALAGEMGYRRDVLLSALCRYRSNPKFKATLAWIDNFPVKGEMSKTRLFEEYRKGAHARAKELGFSLDEIWAHAPGFNTQRLQAILRARNIKGILLPPQPEHGASVEMDWGELSAVTFGYSLKKPALHAAVPNQYRHMGTIMRELRRLGYRRVGAYIDRSIDARCDKHWQAAYWVDYYEQPARDRVRPLFTPDSQHFDRTKFQQWSRNQRLEAVVIVAPVDRVYAPPAGVELVWHSVSPSQSGRAGIDENGLLTGATAVDMLIGMLSRQETGVPEYPQRVLVDGSWQPGMLSRRKHGAESCSGAT